MGKWGSKRESVQNIAHKGNRGKCLVHQLFLSQDTLAQLSASSLVAGAGCWSLSQNLYKWNAWNENTCLKPFNDSCAAVWSCEVDGGHCLNMLEIHCWISAELPAPECHESMLHPVLSCVMLPGQFSWTRISGFLWRGEMLSFQFTAHCNAEKYFYNIMMEAPP